MGSWPFQPILPPRIKKKRVGIISPASPIEPHDLQPALDFLRQRGYTFRLGEHVFSKRNYLAGADRDRAADIHAMFQDPDLEAILCTRGGYGTLRLLPYLDFDLISSHAKILVGYSDITALLMGILARVGLVVFHGPMLSNPFIVEELNGMLDFLEAPKELEFTLNSGMILNNGRAKGRLIGGNLTVLSHMIGTPYFPPYQDIIILVEERGEAPYRIDRALTHLRLSEAKRIRGLVAGEFLHCGDEALIRESLWEFATALDIPCVIGLPLGHGPRNQTIPMGMDATLDTYNGSFLVESWAKNS